MRVLAAFAVLTMVSCISKGVTKVPPPPLAVTLSYLAGAPFTLSALTVKRKEIPLPATRRPTMQFTDTGRVSGLAGVNRYSAEITISGPDGLSFGPVIATKMAGPADAMALESSFLDALSAVTREKLRTGMLQLTSADGATRLVLTR